MTPLDQIYKKGFFKNRRRLSWRAPIVCKAIIDVLHPASVIDVGCATGDLVAEFLRLGLRAIGLEGSNACSEYIEPEAVNAVIEHDLRLPLPDGFPQFDLVTCFEVAEHIEPEFATQFVTNLCKLSDRILISAARPGQAGHYHVNCQTQGYWIDQFWGRHYFRKIDVEIYLKNAWEPWRNKPGIKAYYKNLLYFERLQEAI